MPKEQKEQIKKLTALQKKMERKLKKAIKAELDRFVFEIASFYEVGLQPNMLISLPEHKQKILDILIPHMKEAAVESARFAVTLTTKQTVEEVIDQYIREQGLAASVSITQTSREVISKAVAEAIAEGATVYEIGKIIRKLEKLNKARAELIAITESHNAASFGSFKAAEQVQFFTGTFLYKKWIAVGDDRTRQDHGAMNLKPAIPLDRDFLVGGERASRPGDPRLSARQIIRCRCVLVYQEKP